MHKAPAVAVPPSLSNSVSLGSINCLGFFTRHFFAIIISSVITASVVQALFESNYVTDYYAINCGGFIAACY